MKYILLILPIAFCCVVVTHAKAKPHDDDLTLELVQVLLRHGARTPDDSEINVYNASLASSYEPFELGELTNKGKQQEYQLGQFLRNRYNNYLRSNYKSEDVYAYASRVSRTQMSLQLVLAGLYAPKDSLVWNSQLNWSPIPYVTVPKKLDILLESHKSRKFKDLRQKALESDEYNKKFAKYSELFNLLKQKLKTNENIITIASSTFDLLVSNEYLNLPLPAWYTPQVKQQLREVDELIRDAYVSTPELRKLGPGPLIKNFVKNMNLKEKYKNPRKIYLYGGHDTSIAMFLRVHNVNEFRYVPFGSALILEKLRDKKGKVYVRLLAWDGAGKLTTLKLGNHNEFCPIKDYLNIVENVIPSDEEIDDMLGDVSAKKIKKWLFEDDEVTKE